MLTRSRLRVAVLCLAAATLAACNLPFPGVDSDISPPECDAPEIVELVTSVRWTEAPEPTGLTTERTQNVDGEPGCNVISEWSSTDPQEAVDEVASALAGQGYAVDIRREGASRQYDEPGLILSWSVNPDGGVNVAVFLADTAELTRLEEVLGALPEAHE